MYNSHPPDEKQLSVNCYTMLLTFADGIYTQKLAEDPSYRNYVLPVIKEIEMNYSLPLSVETNEQESICNSPVSVPSVSPVSELFDL